MLDYPSRFFRCFSSSSISTLCCSILELIIKTLSSETAHEFVILRHIVSVIASELWRSHTAFFLKFKQKLLHKMMSDSRLFVEYKNSLSIVRRISNISPGAHAFKALISYFSLSFCSFSLLMKTGNCLDITLLD